MPRLPQPGGDDGSWGVILNDYLNQAHASDGKLKANIIGSNELQSGAVLSGNLANNSIASSKLNATAGTNGQALVLDSAQPGGFKWANMSVASAPPSGSAGGSLTGSYPNPTIASSVVGATQLNTTGSPTNGQLLGYNGSSLAWSDPLSAYTDGSRLLDSFAGATDDAKLTAAITWQQATPGMPAIRLAARVHNFNQTRSLYSGLKLIGAESGPRNPELAGGNYVPTSITLGSAIDSGTSSWWVTPGGSLYDIYMASFSVQGSQGAIKHQFMDVTTGTLYACQFHALGFNFMRGVFGIKGRKFLMTQVVLSGHWTVNNAWETQFYIGGSDNSFWMAGYVNIGVGASPIQAGTYASGSYLVVFEGLSNTNIGYMYITAQNGWRGLRVAMGGGGLSFYGGVYEGYKPINDLASGAAPGTVIRLEGSYGSFYGTCIGQAMNDPDVANEKGFVHMTGGEWSFYAPVLYKGGNFDDTKATFFQSGGRLLVSGATRRGGGAGSTWTNGRPGYQTSATGPNSTDTSFYCPDMSIIPST